MDLVAVTDYRPAQGETVLGKTSCKSRRQCNQAECCSSYAEVLCLDVGNDLWHPALKQQRKLYRIYQADRYKHTNSHIGSHNDNSLSLYRYKQ